MCLFLQVLYVFKGFACLWRFCVFEEVLCLFLEVFIDFRGFMFGGIVRVCRGFVCF